MTDHLHALPPGHRIQEYELVRVLGSGGFGITYLGQDHHLDKPVAIKEYLPGVLAVRGDDHSVVPKSGPDKADYEGGLDRFLSEAQTLARFDHRNIIRIHRFFRAHGTGYVVMEYAEGETLSELLQRKGTLTEAELQPILLPLLGGLEAVHQAGFLHRDIKPGNIVLRNDGSPVLIDFGAARQAVAGKSRSATAIATAGYAPIEQYSVKGHQGPWTDIYGLAAVCYRCLSGERPADATERVRNDSLIPAVRRCEGKASAALLDAIDQALQVEEGERPQSIAEWRQVLSARVEAPAPDQGKNTAEPTVPPSSPSFISELKVCAEQGDAEAQYNLGNMYRQGKEESRIRNRFLRWVISFMYQTDEGIPEDKAEAVRWYRLAAGQGHAKAQHTLGDMYERGEGVPEDSVRAYAWFSIAAAQGYESGEEAKGRLARRMTSTQLTEAQFNLGNMYREGKGTPKDATEAVRWYRLAAEQGLAQAQFNLGHMYDAGEGVPEDDAKAVHWYRRAAGQGLAQAQYNLGIMYYNGEGVPEDSVRAYAWFSIAAAQGYESGEEAKGRLARRMTSTYLAEEQFNLGNMYREGKEVPEDAVEAVRWYRLAAEQGYVEAQYRLGVMYATGEGVPEDAAEAVRWYRLSADQGHASAQYNLGHMYDAGEGVPEDAAEAVRWYRRAAEQGHASAQYNLGHMYDAGEGVPEDSVQAYTWFSIAAVQGNEQAEKNQEMLVECMTPTKLAEAQFNLGNIYREGKGTPKDDVEAVRWYRLAAEQGHAEAQFNLGVMYDNGEGISVDKAKAVLWYRRAADQGHAGAQFNLGAMYANGEGVSEDIAEAVRWYRLAAKQGHAWAQLNLGALYGKGKGVPEDSVQAYAWFSVAAAQGHGSAKDARGRLAGRMTPAQMEEAEKLSLEYRDAYGDKQPL